MQGLVTVFGGSGFVGAQVVRALARKGSRVRVAVRNPGRGYRLRMLGDVGQIEVVQANVRDRPSIVRALAGAEACVNAVAVLYENGRQRFGALHVDGARALAEASRDMGVERFVQISALGAAPDSPSLYARTKAEGEAVVRRVMPAAVVLRPSVVFGPEDHFFNRFAEMAMVSPVLPLIGGGHTKFQPVYVGDVGQAVAEAVWDRGAAGFDYELGGPGVYTFEALMRRLLAEIQRRRLLLPIPFSAATLLGRVGDAIAATPLAPPITTDQVALLRSDNVVSPGALGLADLGVSPTALEGVIPTYLYRYRPGGQYAEDIERIAAAAPHHS
ncbi:MAG: NADH-ubiquinone oxidoreductase 39 kDa subunit precursor [Caulobacteraceae bacterium]|nr:NADH-ubiquinone oxidoreductase 39 kDa subunit precursor [Caulobacteraceae bacterium]